MKRYAILLHRKEWDPTWPESVVPDRYFPETFPVQDAPSGTGKGAQLPILSRMWKYIQAINTEAGYRYARSINMMWINTDYNQDDPLAIPKAESIRCSHNFVRIIGEAPSHYQIASFPHTEDLFKNFDPAKHNWYTMPDLFWTALAANPTNNHINVGNNVTCFLPSLARVLGDGTVSQTWVPKSRVEMLPDLPRAVVVRVDKLNVRRSPSTLSPVVAQYGMGETITILEYRLRGASVWGRTDKGYVALLFSQAPGQRSFLTSWSIRTLGVIPPSPYAEPFPDDAPLPPPPFEKKILHFDVTWQIDADGHTETKRYE